MKTYTTEQIIKAGLDAGIDVEALIEVLEPHDTFEIPVYVGTLNKKIGFNNGIQYPIGTHVMLFKGKYYVGEVSYNLEELKPYVDFA